MKIAIPIWEDKVSPVFDTALRLLVVEIENMKEVSRFIYYIDEQDLNRKCQRVRNLGLDILICGAISHPYLHMLVASGLEVIEQISGPAEEVLEAYLEGNIFDTRFLMPGCKRYRCRYGKDTGNVMRPIKTVEQEERK
jgi:predicted Fe-Mo cluster-binding NifX family protein